jgi:hypothetical protein
MTRFGPSGRLSNGPFISGGAEVRVARQFPPHHVPGCFRPPPRDSLMPQQSIPRYIGTGRMARRLGVAHGPRIARPRFPCYPPGEESASENPFARV